MSKPYFSIIIPTLNEEKRLPLLLSDLKKQTEKNFEVIIVDGQSDDLTQKIAKSWQKQLPLKLISTTTHNVSFQRNLGTKSATADRVLFMDADNRLSNFFLAEYKNSVEKEKPDIATTMVGPETKSISDILGAGAINLHIILTKFSRRPFIMEAVISFKKNVFEKLGGFDASLPCAEGGDIVARALKKGYKLAIFSKPTYAYSLRRAKKQGIIKTAINVAILETTRLLGIKLSKEKLCQLYPMNGGKFYD